MSITEKKLVEEVINPGYGQAAVSFSSLTGQNVKIENTSYRKCTEHACLLDKSRHRKNITIIRTDIIGQMEGASYLILNEEEKRLITEMSLNALGSSVSVDEITVLKEIDNVISAAVITVLSNTFGVSIYGDVPQLFELENIEACNKLISNGIGDKCLLISANFGFEDKYNIAPTFIWKLYHPTMFGIDK